MSTALLENSIVAGRNKIRTSPLDHRTVSISRLWFAYCANQYSTMFGVDLGKADLKSEQNDTSGRGARARNIYSSARQFQRLESKQNRTYNIIIHFNRRSVSISPLTCLFYRREVSFAIHHKFLFFFDCLFVNVHQHYRKTSETSKSFWALRAIYSLVQCNPLLKHRIIFLTVVAVTC